MKTEAKLYSMLLGIRPQKKSAINVTVLLGITTVSPCIAFHPRNFKDYLSTDIIDLMAEYFVI
jgi:hypothetical protein